MQRIFEDEKDNCTNALCFRILKQGGKKVGVASLVLGIVALICGFIPGVSLVGFILALLGVILGALGRKVPEKAGVATGGLVCSIIALVFSCIFFFACGGMAMCSACTAASMM